MTGSPPEPAPEDDQLTDSELLAERPTTAVAPPLMHLSAATIALVAAGGSVGTGLRYGLTLLVPPAHGVPVATILVNVVGAFVLGLLLETLSEFGPDHGLSRRLRLGVGTGVLGGFTTYSTLATDTVTLALSSPVTALAYGVGTVIIGGLASALGIAASRRLVRPLVRQGQEIS